MVFKFNFKNNYANDGNNLNCYAVMTPSTNEYFIKAEPIQSFQCYVINEARLLFNFDFDFDFIIIIIIYSCCCARVTIV
jgi:hypothetical protein